MKIDLATAPSATGLQMDDGRIISSAVMTATTAAGGTDAAKRLKEALELGRVLTMYQPELARHYLDGQENHRVATEEAYELASYAVPQAVVAFARSLLECEDTATRDLGVRVMQKLVLPHLAAIRAAHLDDAMLASIGRYNQLAAKQGRTAIDAP